MSKTTKKQGSLYLPWPGTTISDEGFENLEADFTILQELRGISGVVSVDALTKDQLWRRFIGFEIDEQHRSDLARSLQRGAHSFPKAAWKSSRSVSVIRLTPAIQSESNEESTQSENPKWVLDPNELLLRLERQGPSIEERRTAVLFAETTSFLPEMMTQLLNGLGAFIDEHRFSTNEKIVIALGSAIRKFGLNMSPEHFPRFAAWFGPSETETISHDVELELVKAIVWRLSQQPVDANTPFVELLEALKSLGNDYLTPRLLLQKNHAAIALNATIATVLLASQVGQNEVVTELVRIIREIKVDWFQQQVLRRLKDLIASVRYRHANVAANLESQVNDLL